MNDDLRRRWRWKTCGRLVKVVLRDNTFKYYRNGRMIWDTWINKLPRIFKCHWSRSSDWVAVLRCGACKLMKITEICIENCVENSKICNKLRWLLAQWAELSLIILAWQFIELRNDAMKFICSDLFLDLISFTGCLAIFRNTDFGLVETWFQLEVYDKTSRNFRGVSNGFLLNFLLLI